jgi:hypothetical protein
LLKYVAIEAPLQAGDFCLMADYQGHVKHRVYDEASDSMILVLEDKHWYPVDYKHHLQRFLANGWQPLEAATGSVFKYPAVRPEPFAREAYMNTEQVAAPRGRLSRYLGLFMSYVPMVLGIGL